MLTRRPSQVNLQHTAPPVSAVRQCTTQYLQAAREGAQQFRGGFVQFETPRAPSPLPPCLRLLASSPPRLVALRTDPRLTSQKYVCTFMHMLRGEASRGDESPMDQLVRVLRGLADPTRVRIVQLLTSRDELCVCEIVDALSVPQYTVSRHLSILKAAGVADDWRQGKWMHYRLSEKPLARRSGSHRRRRRASRRGRRRPAGSAPPGAAHPAAGQRGGGRVRDMTCFAVDPSSVDMDISA